MNNTKLNSIISSPTSLASVTKHNSTDMVNNNKLIYTRTNAMDKMEGNMVMNNDDADVILASLFYHKRTLLSHEVNNLDFVIPMIILPLDEGMGW